MYIYVKKIFAYYSAKKCIKTKVDVDNNDNDVTNNTKKYQKISPVSIKFQF